MYYTPGTVGDVLLCCHVFRWSIVCLGL